ncbi:uncharacterized protein LOC129602399 isoform X2 [Paramacrobiotus metropolitanus]|uniref:uncharacterized protein LOC129602399 isoform X2 n=1 Tax=Paramacrobiotus metropolitanus TaxID=2943436 RepID=UPI002445CDC7|nr:uncharacterized protein LOC129602399 isoform X2 [Paramacrobiotus metropolitanus]
MGHFNACCIILLLMWVTNVYAICALEGIECADTIACCGELVCHKGVCVDMTKVTGSVRKPRCGACVAAFIFSMRMDAERHYCNQHPKDGNALDRKSNSQMKQYKSICENFGCKCTPKKWFA